jgi:excisionase family DNA binding protein
VASTKRFGGEPNSHEQVVGEIPAAVVSATEAHVYRQLFDRESLAEYLRLSTDTVDRLVKAGKLPCVRIGAQVRFTLEDVEGFIERNRSHPHTPELLVERLTSFTTSAKPRALRPPAQRVAEPDRPQPIVQAEDLSALRAHAA